jgi:hypothetical protein
MIGRARCGPARREARSWGSREGAPRGACHPILSGSSGNCAASTRMLFLSLARIVVGSASRRARRLLRRLNSNRSRTASSARSALATASPSVVATPHSAGRGSEPCRVAGRRRGRPPRTGQCRRDDAAQCLRPDVPPHDATRDAVGPRPRPRCHRLRPRAPAGGRRPEARTVRGHGLRATIQLIGLPRGWVGVMIVAGTSSGRTVVHTRRYRTCAR